MKTLDPKGVRERKNHNLEHKRSTIAFSFISCNGI